MDISTIVGVVAALVIIFTVQILEGGSPASIILIPSMMLVFGGAFCAGMAGGVLKDATGVGKQLQKAFLAKVTPPTELVDDDRQAGRAGPPRGPAGPRGRGQDGRAPVPQARSAAGDRRHRPGGAARHPARRDRREEEGRQGRREALREHGRLRPDDRHHRHGHGPRARAREPGQAGDARSLDRRRVRRDPLGRAQRQRDLAADRRPAHPAQRRRGRGDGAGRSTVCWPSRPARTRVWSPRSCAACSRRTRPRRPRRPRPPRRRRNR